MRRLFPAALAFTFLISCGSTDKVALEHARKALAKRDFPRTVSELEPLTKRKGEMPLEAYYLYGQAYLGMNNLTQAELNFRSLLEADTSYRDSVAMSYRKRGLELGKVGERELAIECFEQAMRTSKTIDMSEAYSLMGDLYSNFGEYGRSVHYYRLALKTLKSTSARASVWEKLIRILEKLGDPGDAFSASWDAMHEGHYALEPRFSKNGYAYAQDLLNRGKLDSADIVITQILEVPLPAMQRDEIYFLAGEIRLKKGDLEGARAAYREVLKLSVNASNAMIQRARERLAMMGEETK